MNKLKILYYPDNRLRKIAKRVNNISNSIRNIIDNMFEIMYINNGIGLAGTQINIHKRIIVIDISKKRNQQLVLINPILIKKSGTLSINESCLSIPNQSSYIKRAENITIRALDKYGNEFVLTVNGLLAICIQHEMDHLVGKLFIDYL